MSEQLPQRIASRRWILALAHALVLAVTFLACDAPPPPTAPPEVDLTGVDVAAVRAIEGAESNVRRTPRDASAWGILGELYHAHALTGPAEACYREAQTLDATDFRWPYLRALILASEHPEEALAHLRSAAALATGDPSPRFKLAELLFELDEVDAAGTQFRALLEEGSLPARAHLGLARVAFRRGAFEEARGHLEISARTPASARASQLLLAQVEARLGNLDRAAAARTAAEALAEPGWPDATVREMRSFQRGLKDILVRADVLLGHGQSAEARKLLEPATREYPDAVFAWILLARAHIAERNIEPADAALRKALALEPDSVEAQFRLGFCFILKKDYREAASWFRRASELKPDFSRAHFNLGSCLVQLGEIEDAIPALRASLRSDPQSAETHALLGHALALRGQLEEAAKELEEALRLDPDSAWARQRAAEVDAQLHGGR